MTYSKGWAALFFGAATLSLSAQIKNDTLATFEVVSTEKGGVPDGSTSAQYSLQQAEEQMAQSPEIALIQRGGYAPELSFRGLTAFQTQVTLDGMRVFGACTDRMDPVTSYVESPNLSAVHQESGGGLSVEGLSIRTLPLEFSVTPRWSSAVFSGYRSNGNEIMTGASIGLSSPTFSFQVNGNLRKANPYTDGNGNKVRYTQYEKQNLLAKSLFQKGNHQLGLNFLIDDAYDVGYAALPMDVAYAKSRFVYGHHQFTAGNWLVRNQLYLNAIEHVMDDTPREDVIIHMDMPGWSRTVGLNGSVTRYLEKGKTGVKYEAFRNYRKAEMTMYPPNEIEMFMYTWAPMYRNQIVITPFVSFQHNKWKGEARYSFTLSRDQFLNQMGYNQLAVFGYAFDSTMAFSAHTAQAEVEYQSTSAWKFSYKVAAGARILTLSELYGFYLFNAQDGFDYVGNPELENEGFVKQDVSAVFQKGNHRFKVTGFGYLFQDYIFGIPQPQLFTMTLGANGVKQYHQVGNAGLVGLSAEHHYQSESFHYRFSASYQRGKSQQVGNLPWVSPLTVRESVSYKTPWGKVSVQGIWGMEQNQFSELYGENATPSYALLNGFYHYQHAFEKFRVNLQVGVENIFDRYYFTHIDWGDIPRRGRNFTLSVKLSL